MRNTTKSFPVQDATPLPQMARLDRTDFRSPKQKSPSDPHGSFGLPSQCQTNVIGGPTGNCTCDNVVQLQSFWNLITFRPALQETIRDHHAVHRQWQRSPGGKPPIDDARDHDVLKS
jgi:hypothetical protein